MMTVRSAEDLDVDPADSMVQVAHAARGYVTLLCFEVEAGEVKRRARCEISPDAADFLAENLIESAKKARKQRNEHG